MRTDPTMTTLQYLALIHQVSYTNVCKDVEITPQQFSDWIKKRRPVPKERLRALGKYFNMDAKILVDDHYYLKDLSIEMKIQIQTLFLNRLIENAEEGADIEAYREKLIQLEKEREHQTIIGRFAAIVEQADAQTLRLCRAFLSHIEGGEDLTAMKTMLNLKESER
ncbi:MULTISPECIES: XRE family transcriptional regulator [unclassified Paenibacillus]|uniref:XRE family transcriptional regulator n=1 Tax=unclassified Paenibacillus TaxID=185978 RepID=UPI001C0F5D84|nr:MULTISPECIES: XRE family transcriptional regulator [unclassified Paenibacillus]MBU5442016.1 XRE family transcriptional regulator [Paenibacillus sp. MSJ-34]CAH0120448.1 hypothetical protein PAE9249_02967 [Paenibacillus sp. CECT 9249]